MVEYEYYEEDDSTGPLGLPKWLFAFYFLPAALASGVVLTHVALPAPDPAAAEKAAKAKEAEAKKATEAKACARAPLPAALVSHAAHPPPA